jgi:alkaline phosphatase
MKLRNQLLALFCMLVFAAFGFLYVRTWVVQKPFGIILFISDGLVAEHLAAARLYQGGAEQRLAIESFPNLALVRNAARDFAVPDDAAVGTALATGVKVGHRNISMDAGGKPLMTILDLARGRGRAVGLVSTGNLASAVPAAFYAHSTDSRDRQGIAAQLGGSGKLDVVLAGGAGDFTPEAREGRRQDGRDLIAELQGAGWEIVRSKAELANAAAYRTAGIAGFFSGDQLAFSNQIESGSQQPSLSDMVRRAIQFLQVHGQGYVLVVDASLATTAAERNEGERVITETLALDHAIKTAMDYAGDKSLIVAVGKHATGGMSLNGYPLVQDHGVALLGVNASGEPAITWATGPNGPASKTEPAAFQTPSALNTAEDVVAIGRGDGSAAIRAFIDETAIFGILKDAL